MSYDIRFEIDTGGLEPAVVGSELNHTYNCSRMFRAALGGHGIYELDGKLAGEMVPILEAAVADITNPDREPLYRELNPPNKWGSHKTATEFLKQILENAHRHPKAIIRIT